jgi:hypothetical protein
MLSNYSGGPNIPSCHQILSTNNKILNEQICTELMSDLHMDGTWFKFHWNGYSDGDFVWFPQSLQADAGIQVKAFWVVMPSNGVVVYQHYGGLCCLQSECHWEKGECVCVHTNRPGMQEGGRVQQPTGSRKGWSGS